MTCVEKVEFENWFDSYRGKEYNFAEEIERYVMMLRFYKEVKELCSVEPFFGSLLITIAGLSMRIYKSLFMLKAKSGYVHNVNQSVVV